MSVLLILRQIILIFLLIASPFLALLLPFIFIRNTGFIWIGEFFRWLLYGPLFALFIASLARIWKAGIPYAFDFTRAKMGEIVYPTAINILYGGPGQALSPVNTSNYIDTYAEYVIGIIMLWAAILLPWFLLRIFRDYCCDVLQKNQAALLQILDKLRAGPPPPRPTPPSPIKPAPINIKGKAFELPFKKRVSVTQSLTKDEVVEKIQERKQEKVNTQEIARAFDLKVSSLSDIAKIETNKETEKQVSANLSKIQNPAKAFDITERKQFSTIRQELTTRAESGDRVANQIIQAASLPSAQKLKITTQVSPQILKQAVEKPGVPVIIPQAITPNIVKTVSQKTQISKEKVENILKSIPLELAKEKEKVELVAKKLGLPEKSIQEVITTASNLIKEEKVSKAPIVSIEEYEEIKNMWLRTYRQSEIPLSEKISSRKDWLREDIKKLTNTLNLLTSPVEENRQKGLEELSNVLPFLLLGGFSDIEALTYLKAKLEAAKQAVEEEELKNKHQEETMEKVKIPIKKKTEEKTMELKSAKEKKLQ